MANISIKKDFKDGDKLLAQQLNNNFSVIEAGVHANEANLENVIQDAEGRLKAELENITADRGWDWNEGDRVTFFKGSEEEVKNQEVKDGQLLYNETTGETYLDNEGKRIVTGSGNVVSVGSEQPTNTATKIWIEPEDLADPVPNEIAISPTEPTTGEEVWIKKGKNLFNLLEMLGAYSSASIIEKTSNRAVLKGTANTFQYLTLNKYLKAGTYTFQRKWNLISGKAGAQTGVVFITKASDSSSLLELSSSMTNGTFTINEDMPIKIVIYLSIGTALTEETQIEVYDIQLEQGSIVSEFEEYVEKEIYVKNDNGVYEEFIPKIEQNILNEVEYETGRIIDGKKEYGKRISCGALPNNTTKDVATGLTNVNLTRPVTGFFTDSTHYSVFPLPYVSSYLAGLVSVYATKTNTKVTIKTGEDKSAYTVSYVDLYYTKN